MTSCSKSKCLINIIAVFIFTFSYDYIVHGMILAGAYEATASIWRPQEQMQEMGLYCIAFHLALAILYSALYKMSCASSAESCTIDSKKSKKATQESTKTCPIKRGACFGTILGLILAVTNAAAYLHIPIPASLAISWFFAGLFQGFGIGVLLALINNRKGCNANG